MYCFYKRWLDIVLAIGGMCILSPLFLLIALSIRLDSQGPVFYRGERVGRGGGAFRIWKFRTMDVDAEVHGTTTALGDVRITRIGGSLRRYKLDELPQLYNVILGEMSLVGPRPEVAEHTSQYDAEEECILSVRPGITDYASIQFASLDELVGADDAHQVYVSKIRHEKNQLRIKYVRDQSFLVDMGIILETVRVILKKISLRAA